MPQIDYESLFAAADQRAAAKKAATEAKKKGGILDQLGIRTGTARKATTDYGDQDYIAAGEDERITSLYRRLADLGDGGGSSILGDLGVVRTSPEQRAAQKEAARRRIIDEFVQSNPELDPRVADETVQLKTPAGKLQKSSEEVVRSFLQVMANPKAKDNERIQAWTAYSQARPSLSPALRAKYQLDDFEAALQQQEKSKGWFEKNVKLPTPVVKTLDLLDRPSQFTLTALGAGKQAITGKDQYGKDVNRWQRLATAAKAGASVLDPSAYVTNNRLEGLVQESGLDTDESGRITNLREALGKDPDAGGRALGLVDFIGTQALDPTNYVTFGTGGQAKAGLSILRNAGKQELAEQIARYGMKSLDDVQRQVVEDTIRQSVRETISSGANKKVAKQVAKAGEGQADAVVERAISDRAAKLGTALERRGQGGLVVGGRTVVSRPRTGAAEKVAASEITDVRSVVPAAQLAKGDVLPRFGNAVVESVDEATRRVTLRPAETVVVQRGVGTEVKSVSVRPGDVKPGDVVGPKGNWVVDAVTDDGQLVFKAANDKDWVQRDFTVLPRERAPEVVGQGSIITQKENGLLPQADQGTLFELGDEAPATGATPAGAAAPDTVPVPERMVTIKSLTAPVRTSGGGTTSRRVWGTAGAGGRRLNEGLTIVDRAGADLGVTAGWTDEGALKLTGTSFNVGDEIPELRGRVAAKNGDVVEVLPVVEETERKYLQQRVLRGAGEAPAAPPAAAAQGELFPTTGYREITEGGYPDAVEVPDPKKLTEEARLKIAKLTGGADEAAADAQLPLFDRGLVPVKAIEPGDFIVGADVRVVRSQGDNLVVRFEDNIERTVRRSSDVPDTAVAPKDLKAGMELPDLNGKVVKVNDDGTVVISALTGGIRFEDIVDAGGTVQTKGSLVARKTPANKAFRPRGGIEKAEKIDPQRILKGTAEKIRSAEVRAQGTMSRFSDSLDARVGGAYDALKKELGAEESQRVLRLAFDLKPSQREKLASLISGYAIAGREGVVQALETLRSVRDEIKALADEKTMTPSGTTERLFEGATPLPLIATKKGQKALGIDSLLAQALATGKTVDQVSPGFDWGIARRGKQVAFTVDADTAARLAREHSDLLVDENSRMVRLNLDDSVEGINRQASQLLSSHAREVLGLAEGEAAELFDSDVLSTFFMRGHAAAASAIEADLLRALSQPFGTAGEGIVRIAATEADEAAAAAERLVPVRGFESAAGRAYAEPEVAEYLSRYRSALHDDEVIKRYQKGMEWYSNFLARYQTSALTKGTGFMARNTFGNVWVNTVEGVRPQFYGQAAQVQNAQRKIGKLMRREGVDWETAAARSGVPDWTVSAIRKIDEHGVTSSGFFRSDSWNKAKRQAEAVTRPTKAKAGRAVNPFGEDFVATKAGGLLNQWAEDNARIAHFLSKADELGSFEAARGSVARTLFDYDDLTPFEKVVAKRFNRFYTYMRKNVGLQAAMFARMPGRYANLYEAKDAALGAGGERDENLLFPDGERQGTHTAGAVLNKLLGGKNAKGVVTVETPIDAAFQALDPGMTALMMLPGLRDTVPSGPPTGKDLARSVLNTQLAGGPVQLVETVFEIATGKDVYTDRDLTQESTRDKLIGLVAPLYTQSKASYDVAANRDRADLVKFLVGVGYQNRNTDKYRNAINWAYIDQLEQIIARMKARGEDPPSITELRDAGLLGDEEKKPRSVPTSKEEKKSAAREKLLR